MLKLFSLITLILFGHSGIQGQVANFTPAPDNGCDSLEVVFINSSTGDNLKYEWDFDDGTTSDLRTPPSKFFKYRGSDYDVSLIVTDTISLEDDTAYASITVYDRPDIEFTMSSSQGCVGDQITFTLVTTGVSNYSWYPQGDFGAKFDNVDPYTHTYNIAGNFVPYLKVGTCKYYDSVATIHDVRAQIGFRTEEFCHQRNVYFDNQSSGNDESNLWDLGNGDTSTDLEPVVAYDAGDYTVTLDIAHPYGCVDDTAVSFTINSLPVVTVGNDTTICLGDSAQLWASGGNTIVWTPGEGLDNDESYTPQASPLTSTEYSAQVRDDITGCRSNSDDATIVVTVIDVPDIQFEILSPSDMLNPDADTTVFTGADVVVRADTNAGYTYLWSPDNYLSCLECVRPTITPLEEGEFEYSILVRDTLGCKSLEDNLTIIARELYTLGISEAFTPNGDGINDHIMVAGYGVKEIKEFSVFNRWGVKVYSTADMDDIGWDGIYNGKEQAVDTYTYYVKAEMLNDTVIEKRGAFSLLR